MQLSRKIKHGNLLDLQNIIHDVYINYMSEKDSNGFATQGGPLSSAPKDSMARFEERMRVKRAKSGDNRSDDQRAAAEISSALNPSIFKRVWVAGVGFVMALMPEEKKKE